MPELTRRNLFAALAAATTASAPAQTTGVSRDEDLKSAHDAITNNLAQLAKVKVPIETEPAFVFKA